MQVSDFPTILKADFGRFRPFSGLFRPYRQYRPPADTSWYGRYGRYGPILAESARFGANRSRFGTNRSASARIRGKKNPDAVRRAGNRVGRRVPRRAASNAGAAPLVPRPCFLAYHVSITFFRWLFLFLSHLILCWPIGLLLWLTWCLLLWLTWYTISWPFHFNI